MAKFEKVETYVIPRYLYRYRSLQQFNREMDCIKQAYLYCANFVQMNDPMEGFYSESKLLEKARDIGGIRAAIASRKTMIGMCAFSEVFNHELMWAHYADQFRGICITYDFFKLRHNLPAGTSFSRIYYNEEVQGATMCRACLHRITCSQRATKRDRKATWAVKNPLPNSEARWL